MDSVPRKRRHKAVYQTTNHNTPEQRRRWIDRQIFAQSLHKKLHASNENRCAACGWTPPPFMELFTVTGHKPSIIELHHVIPVSAGGQDTEENVVPLCPNHHRIADILTGVSDYGGRKMAWITDRGDLLKFLSLLDSDPDACAKEILRKREEAQSIVTGLLSDLLSE
ncbi:MAG: hypothetical protein JWL77_4155 [Chthonomonadaceae bacterium]|nr:hypothetical protein [Chthonomonadaceae bacterium]